MLTRLILLVLFPCLRRFSLLQNICVSNQQHSDIYDISHKQDYFSHNAITFYALHFLSTQHDYFMQNAITTMIVNYLFHFCLIERRFLLICLSFN